MVTIALLAGSCSSVPPQQWPQHDESTVLLDYRAPAGGRIAVPVSGPRLTIFEFATEPAGLQDEFHDGARFLALPPDCDSVRVRCHYRAYAGPDGVPPPEVLFPGSVVVRRTPANAPN